MPVTVKLPAQLRDSVGGASEAQAEGSTVGEVLESLFDLHPALRDRISDGDGVRRFVNVYLSGEDIRFLEGTDTPVTEGAELTILPAVAGG
jgi:molybdopterin converting factor small subunit